MPWTCGIRVDKVKKDLLQFMSKAGCVKINFGVESGSPRILKYAKKNISLTQIKTAVKWAYEADIYNSCSFIIGHPQDTHKTIQTTLNFAEKLLKIGATSCTFNMLTPFPGTYVYEQKDELNLKFITNQWKHFNFLEPVYANKNLTINDMRRYLVKGLYLWKKYSSKRENYTKRIEKRDRILLGDLLGRKVQTC